MRVFIEDIFNKKIDRDMQGVIKVGDGSTAAMQHELDEYVVTDELADHIASFYQSYCHAFSHSTDRMGVWVSGFYGSGKSHLLKILSYLLENRKIGADKAAAYFVAEHKTMDAALSKQILQAAEYTADVVLFNVDAIGRASDPMVITFLRAFLRQQGYAENLPLALLEQDMHKEQVYHSFMHHFAAIHGAPWQQARSRIDYIGSDFVAALAASGYMTEESGKQWHTTINQPIDMDIDTFASHIRTHIDHCAEQHRVVFLADEMGQYIGENTQRMLNLQTIVEELGSKCEGRAWVVVSSQQQLEHTPLASGEDYSKIQGRFDTRLTLSSANTDEVIRQRLLHKTNAGHWQLQELYQQKSIALQNLVFLESTDRLPLPQTADVFAADYPFLSYQFPLLTQILQQIRTHAASGEHISQGERSMLAIFQQCAVQNKTQKVGALVPLHHFYEALAPLLEENFTRVIIEAEQNSNLLRHAQGDGMVHVLQTLLLLSFCEEPTATIATITSLMVQHIDEDRLQLQEQILQALDLLASQQYIQKNGDVYQFLTQNERQIARTIEQQEVSVEELQHEVGRLIFGTLLNSNICSHKKLGKEYRFRFRTAVDRAVIEQPRPHESLGVRIITPLHQHHGNAAALRQLSKENGEVVAELAPDTNALSEIKQYMQIERFLRVTQADHTQAAEELRIEKTREITERKSRSLHLLEQSLASSKLYIHGQNHASTHSSAAGKIQQAMALLVTEIYPRLRTIEQASTSNDIEHLFEHMNGAQEDTSTLQQNEQAQQEVLRILQATDTHKPASLKPFIQQLRRPPYGYRQTDTLWLLTALLAKQQVVFYRKDIAVLGVSSQEQLCEALCNNTLDSISVAIQTEIAEQDKQQLRHLLYQLSGQPVHATDADSLWGEYKTHAQALLADMQQTLQQYTRPSFDGFPGEELLEKMATGLQQTLMPKQAADFYAVMRHQHSQLTTYLEEYGELRDFLQHTRQKELFETAVQLLHTYDCNQLFLIEQTLIDVAEEIRQIIVHPAPYASIHRLTQYNPALQSMLQEQLEQQRQQPLQKVQVQRESTLQQVDVKQTDAGNIRQSFDALEDEIRMSDCITYMLGVAQKAHYLRRRWLQPE